MKLKDGLWIGVLLDYGFVEVDKEEDEDDESPYMVDYDYKFEIGHSRRGQFYYLLVKESTRKIIIYATKPDGSGGVIGCPDVLVKLISDGVIVEG